MDLSAAKLKRFEQWRQQSSKEDIGDFIRANYIYVDTSVPKLQNGILGSGRTLASDRPNQVIAKARLPFNDPGVDYRAEHTALYIAKNMFSIEEETVLWMFDGAGELYNRYIQCEAGGVDRTLDRVRALGLIKLMPMMTDNHCRLFWKRVNEWYEYQVLTEAVK
jgi:hypothetical protein